MSPAPARAVGAVCSICLEADTEVTTLVASPGVWIGDGGVALCRHMVTGASSPRTRVTPWEGEIALDRILTGLPRMAAAGAQVETRLGRWVDRARARGAT